jgi:hypothetical protein
MAWSDYYFRSERLLSLRLAQNWERAEIQASIVCGHVKEEHASPEDQSGLIRDHKTNLMLSLLLVQPLCSSSGSL